MVELEFVGWNSIDGEPCDFSSAVTVQRESPLRKGVATRVSGRMGNALEMVIRVSGSMCGTVAGSTSMKCSRLRGRLDTQKVMVA